MSDLWEYRLIAAKSGIHFDAARQLFKEYAAGLNFDLDFQNFDVELSEIDVHYNLPGGGLVLVRHASKYVGCAGIRKFENKVAELKRMYIQADHRGLGLGKLLLDKAIRLAKSRGYDRIRLDTVKTMKNAIRLYKESGFYTIAAYRFNPNEDALYFEKELK